MTSCLITNVRILDGTGREPFAGSVRVEGNRIADVSAGSSSAAPPGDRIVDGRGATLMPGLIEPHAHLSFADVVSYELTRLPPEEHLLATEGVDLLKLNLSGDLGTSAWSSELTPMSEAEVGAAMEVARARGLRVCAHCRSGDSVRMAVRHGIEIIYHANYCDERALDALEAARDRVFVAPALGITYNLSQANGQWGVTPDRAVGFERELAASVETISRMRARGIRVLPGGDYGFVYNPHGTYARDLWLFVKVLGFSPMETLVAATRLGGEIMGQPGELGVVKAGALADLLLVDGDPLADIAILQDRSALRMIMKDAALLAAQPELTRATDDRRRNPLHFLCSLPASPKSCDLSIRLARHLLGAGIDIDAPAFVEGAFRATPL